MRQLSMLLRAGERVVSGLRFDAARCERAARDGHANATELADYLVEKGTPFREAHHIAGRAVRAALEQGCALEELGDDALAGVDGRLEPDVRAWLTLDRVLSNREVPGGVGPRAVRSALEAARDRLAR